VMLPHARFTDARLDPAFLCSRILRTHHQMTMATAHAGGDHKAEVDPGSYIPRWTSLAATRFTIGALT
jgi:hypothetical protein